VVLSVGLAVGGYLRAEFAPPQSPTSDAGPLAWAIGELSATPAAFPWICAATVFMVSLLARVVLTRVRREPPR
jgi:hypothetical protein